MATQAASPEQGFTYRRSPSATEAFEGWLKEHGQELPKHTERWDVSRSDIYVEDRWQPIFAEMRAAGQLHWIPESPFGPYWAVVGHKAIQHIEALPETFSSSWEYGGITILNRLSEEEAVALIVNGFVRDVLQHLPMEFMVETQKLIAISLEGSVG